MKYFFFFILLILATLLQGQELQINQIPGLFFNQPVDIATTYVEGDSRVFVLEKRGRIYIVDDPDSENPSILADPFLDIISAVDDDFEGGLLGLAFHPDFADNGYFFLNYTIEDNSGDFATVISRWSVDPNNMNLADANSEEIVMTIPQPKKNHNGGDIAFGADGMLYIPTGDGGGAGDIYQNGQDHTSLLGKVLRINVDELPYTIPVDNPFVGDDFTLDEIWSIGWRNPWKFSFDRETGDFWAADVGQNEIEEVDFEAAGDVGGRNYGWNCFEGLLDYNPYQCPDGIDHTEPVFWYDQSQGWKSITGGYVYRGTRHPDLIGKYIFTDFEDSRVFWLTEQVGPGDFSTIKYEFNSPGFPIGVATFGESSKGELYFATFLNGQLWRISTSLVNETSEKSRFDFTISPNPVAEILEISVDAKFIQSMRIYDLSGNEHKVLVQQENTVDVRELPQGSYILTISIEGKDYSKKFVKI